jgi:ribosomal protein L13E
MTTTRPKVFKKHGERRFGKGFSLGELKKAGMNFKEVKELGIPTDPRRRTAHEENIEIIKVFLRDRKTVSKSRKTTRKPKR